MKSVPQPQPLTALVPNHPAQVPMPQLARITPADLPMSDVRPPLGLRLRLKPKSAPTGYVDGGWWPRSNDLSLELPALAHVLGVRLGPVVRVAFSLDAWDAQPRHTTVDGRTVRLEGFHSQDRHVVHVSGSDGARISLLVVPPEAGTTAAHDAMTTASRRGNTDHPVRILAAEGIVPDTTALDTTAPRLRLVTNDSHDQGPTP